MTSTANLMTINDSALERAWAVLETVPDPVLGTGEVLVDVVAAGVLPYTDEVISGARNYLLQLPESVALPLLIRDLGQRGIVGSHQADVDHGDPLLREPRKCSGQRIDRTARRRVAVHVRRIQLGPITRSDRPDGDGGTDQGRLKIRFCHRASLTQLTCGRQQK